MQHTLVAVFDNRADAQAGMDELLKEGFAREAVRLSEAASDTHDITRDGASAGADDGSFMSGVKHFFGNLFGDDDDQPARQYSEAVMRGSHVLSVTTDDQAQVERAADLIERFGPTDIDEKETQWRAGAGSGEMQHAGAGARQDALAQAQSQQRDTGASENVGSGSANAGGSRMGAGAIAGGADTTAIPIIEERLKVGKRDVQRGGVRVYQRMVETPVNESVTLREERVSVERRPVDQPAGSADLTGFREQTLELRETAEEAVVEKSARVVEEVVIGKQVSEREQVISDTVRHTEVDVEQLTPGAVDTDQSAYRTHFSAHYTDPTDQYEQYAPAYAYGASQAGASGYKGRSWDDAETSLRSDWESRNPHSTWEKMKDAVRYGWDKITSPL